MMVGHFCCTAFGYAALQAMLCMFTRGFVFRPSDINIISISVQRFSELPEAGMTMGGPYGQSIFILPQNLLGRCPCYF